MVVLPLGIVSGQDYEAPDWNQNWHQWRGPQANGVAPLCDPPVQWDKNTNVKWKAEIPGQGASNETRQILAVRGYVRLIGLSNERPAEDTLKMYKAAMEVAHQPDEKKLVLSGVSNVPSRNVLEFVERYLEDGQIKAEAKIAYEKISDLLKTGLRRRTAPRLQNR